MREALQLLSELTREDLDWLFFAGHERQVIANTQIIIEGQYPDALYFVLQGLLGIRPGALGDSTLIHRTEDDMNGFFQASAFHSSCSKVLFEEQGINLFAECIRGAE
jgi:hypothetical protein